VLEQAVHQRGFADVHLAGKYYPRPFAQQLTIVISGENAAELLRSSIQPQLQLSTVGQLHLFAEIELQFEQSAAFTQKITYFFYFQ